MRVLILYPWYHHNGMINTFGKYLEQYAVYADSLCLDQYQFQGKHRLDVMSFFILWLGRVAKKIHPYFIQARIIGFLESKCFHYIFKNYDIIDLHSFMDFYRNIVRDCVENDHQYDITVWGSDVLRATDENFNAREFGYHHARQIKGFDKLLDVLSKVYAQRYDDKMVPAYLGDSLLRIIDDISDDERIKLAEKLGIYHPDKILVTCGYNASPSQQHSIMIEAVKNLEEADKRRIHVILPMMYDKAEPYFGETVSQLKECKVNYTVLGRFLNERELAVLRIQSQIMIDTQTTDSFNGALRETLFAENVTLIADWLEYPPYDREHVYYICINKSNLCTTLHSIINTYDEYKKKCGGNKEKLRKMVSWEYCIKPWADSYNSLKK